MKAMKIMGFLAAMFVVSNMQSMELPDEYVLEQQLVDDEISVEEYLTRAESLETHPNKLKELRTAIYDGDNLYTILIARLKDHLKDVTQALKKLDENTQMDEEERLREKHAILDIFKEVIAQMHTLLHKWIFKEEARLPR